MKKIQIYIPYWGGITLNSFLGGGLYLLVLTRKNPIDSDSSRHRAKNRDRKLLFKTTLCRLYNQLASIAVIQGENLLKDSQNLNYPRLKRSTIRHGDI